MEWQGAGGPPGCRQQALAQLCAPLGVPHSSAADASSAAAATAAQLGGWAAEQGRGAGTAAPPPEVMRALVEALWRSLLAAAPPSHAAAGGVVNCTAGACPPPAPHLPPSPAVKGMCASPGSAPGGGHRIGEAHHPPPHPTPPGGAASCATVCTASRVQPAGGRAPDRAAWRATADAAAAVAVGVEVLCQLEWGAAAPVAPAGGAPCPLQQPLIALCRAQFVGAADPPHQDARPQAPTPSAPATSPHKPAGLAPPDH